MQVREQHQPLAKKYILLLHRLFDLDNQVGVAPHVVGRAHNLRARVLILVVGEGRKLSGARLHQHLMSGFAQGFHAGRGNPHAAFVVLHFLRNTNDHASPAVCKELRGRLKILHPGAQETPQLAGQDSRRNRFAQKDRCRIHDRIHRIATDQNRGNLRPQGPDVLDQARPLHPRHSRVGNDRVDFFNLIARRFQTHGSVFAGDYLIPGALRGPW